MRTNITNLIGTPLWVLATSLFAGLIIDALAHDLAGQTSRRIRYTPPVQELEKQEEKTQDDEEDIPIEELGDRVIDTLTEGWALNKPIMDIPLNIVDTAQKRPADESKQLFELDYSSNYPNTFQHRIASWCAPNIRYQPLYFEDVALERYGYHSRDLWQPVSSALHYGVSFTLLPLNMIRERPASCTYPLGFCRPGSYAPQTKPRWLKQR